MDGAENRDAEPMAVVGLAAFTHTIPGRALMCLTG